MIWNSFDHANLARALLTHGHYDGAMTACRMGLSKTPDSAELHVLLACAFDGLGRPDGALAECDRALAIEDRGPSALEARIRQALVLFSAGDVARAFAAIDCAWNLAPGNIHVHTVVGNLLAWHGELSAALGHIEWNWTQELEWCLRRFNAAPPWNGEDLAGKRVLVVHQQGYGDMLQMARYLDALRARAAHVIVECLPSIANLMRRIRGVDDVVPFGTADPGGYDVYARLMTLPRILGIDAGAGAPYVAPEPHRLASWKGRLGERKGVRVGLAWGGNPSHAFDFQRALPPERLALLGAVSGVTYYSLMLEPNVDVGFDIVRIGEAFSDFDDAAAAMSELDLVITVDTAYAHLAGALGVRVWTLLPRRPDWRWGGSGDTTMWYPSMRLFRETEPGWPTVVERTKEQLSTVKI